MSEPTRVRRLGTFTAGVILILFGVLFLLHFFLDTVSYERIFSLWPLILISLGVELLLSGRTNIIYDKGAILLLLLLTLFAMGMAAADLSLRAWGEYLAHAPWIG